MSYRLLLGAASLTLLAAVACGSARDSGFDDGNEIKEAPPPSSTDPGGTGDFGTSGSNGTTNGDEVNCAATVAKPEKAKVDIIFVIDNSGSMTGEMNQIKTNVNSFAQKIGNVGLDYHVVFLVKKASSSTQTGNVICVPPPLGGANCTDNLPTFAHVNQDVQSSNSLSLILSTYDNANAALAWNKHLRVEATKVFVEVTDDESALASTSFDQQLLAKAPAGMFGTAQARKYIFHSIISKPFADK